jgi:ABC-type multidrug transport system fused ATPase/permease subunit
MENISYIRRFFPYLRPWRRYAIWSCAISLALALLNLPLPFFLRYIIDKIIPRREMRLLLVVSVVLLVLLVLRLAMNYVNGLLLAIYRERVIMNLRIKMFEHMQRLSMDFYGNNKSGYLMSRMSNDTAKVQGVFADTLVAFIINVLTFIVGLGAMLYLNSPLTLIALSPLPFIIFFQYRYSRNLKDRSEHVQETMGDVFGMIAEAISGVHVVKSFTAEESQSRKLSEILGRQFKANIGFVKAVQTTGVASSFFSSLGPLLILFFGIRDVMAGKLTLGSYLAFSAFVGYLYSPAQVIMSLNVSVQDALAALKRVFEIFDTEEEDEGIESFVSLDGIKGEVEFKNVSFAYGDSKDFEIQNVSFKASAGSKYAVVGRSGAGKTTLMNLLCRFFRPEEGAIYIDGVDIARVRAKELRKNIGIVPQNAFLFSGTIGDNIRLARIDATDAEVAEAAKAANIYSFIASLEKGFDTEVGERGVKLSGGERQRIAIARAILGNASILILDEATSEIDSETEGLIQDSLEKLMNDRTTFAIAHRLSTVVNARQIFFIEEGRLIARGTHEELYETTRQYRELCDEQFQRF